MRNEESESSGETAPEVALLTPPGVGAIAVIRVSGHGAKELIEPLIRRRGRASASELAPDRVVRADFLDDEEPLDDVLIVADRLAGDEQSEPGAQASGQSIDICAHGGVRVVERIIGALTKKGAVFRAGDTAAPAWPSANLIEQDGWSALAHARTRQAVRWLLKVRTGLPAELRRIAKLGSHDHEAAAADLRRLIDAAPGCRRLLEGATVALVGPPNAGKSTLANRLIGEERALVSPRAGTTLDWLAQPAAIEGVPITLLDTPGYAPGFGVLDRAAMERAAAVVEKADARLLVFDGSAPPPREPRLESLPAGSGSGGGRAILVLNKSDLGTVWTPDQIAHWNAAECITVSAITGANLESLKSRLLAHLGVSGPVGGQLGLFSERQLNIAKSAGCDPISLSSAIWALLGEPPGEESG